ncbi:hypothetical protein DMB44_00820 [Thermoplasma sp. Kam2015]|nr:hypothetical protein DMB44_00820 [Thermoplasma sp. Kam2015]
MNVKNSIFCGKQWMSKYTVMRHTWCKLFSRGTLMHADLNAYHIMIKVTLPDLLPKGKVSCYTGGSLSIMEVITSKDECLKR